MNVVVVGAGLAGLRATEVLLAAGCDVTLIEGGRRAGGRVRSVDALFAAGQVAESGAEWVDSIHTRLLEKLDQFGIQRLGLGEQWTTIRRWIHRNGELLGPDQVRATEPGVYDELDEFDRIIDAAAAGISDPSRPWLHSNAAALDARSLADVANDAQLGELARLFKSRDSQGEFAEEPSRVSLLFVAQQRAYSALHGHGMTVKSHRVAGGFSAVAQGMAAPLGDVLSFGENLVGLEQDADGVVVSTDRRAVRADHVVVACSLVPLRNVAFHTPAPPALRAAIDELGYGTVTKTAVQWPHRGWPAGYATTSGRAQRVYEPTVDQPGEPGVLMAYCGGDGGREWARLPEADRIASAAEEMRAMHHLVDEPLDGFSRAWSNEPRYGGSYAVYHPGQVTAHWQVLREPWGRVHLAGEHVADCTGYMEGALESGENVAARIVGAG
ncbi:MAG TPA: NAD(P)/FAD-dependent oxidoreductase [Ilumatobacteraceae bacterium]|nr:NAD(P)/FAD-dependent oxidoreductase [Ilumatobacteraceae bacterium]HRB02911.1 NAD(P)/FAD-dependent oxidoreductase [Ilumatobacteraceae bacterium]